MTSPLLDRLRRGGALGALDVHFADRLADLCGEERPEVRVAAALAAHRTSEAHVCLELREVAGRPPEPLEDTDAAILAGLRYPALGSWLSSLGQSPLVGETAPLVLEGTRLYLRRYHEYETRLAADVRSRLGGGSVRVDRALLATGLRRLFPPSADRPDWQRVAAAVCVLRRFALVSGGPGTGKTRTVARILALLVEQGLALDGRPPRLHLLAPTGKAAARLRESIREERGRLDVDPRVRAAIPDDASTIHRALGAGPGGFRLHEGRTLVTDAVVVDEASMVDLALMARLLAALPPDARVILLGDRDQLASVQAGSVLADLCGDDGQRTSRFTPPFADSLRDLTGDEVRAGGGAAIDDSIVYLQKSWRFAEREGIGRVAAAIRELASGGSPETVVETLRAAGPAIELLDPADDLAARIGPRALEGYAPILGDPDPERRLARLSEFRILCAHRRGRNGVVAMNAIIETALAEAGLVRASEPGAVGRALLVTRNDRATRLYNGDVGLVAERSEPGRGLVRKAVFPDLDGEAGEDPAGVRWISLARLPATEPAFAMTVHKSQGSEFDRLLVVLPEAPSPVLTRELLYTALTRARDAVTLVARPEVIAAAARTATRRSSGLASRLRPGRAEEGA